jgi:DNA-directed RNA polymerase subunit RPC12/RpoP
LGMGVVVFKCINCGGPLGFKADTQNWICDYCLSEFSEQEVREFISNEQAQAEAETSSAVLDELREQELDFQENALGYTCQSCGAEIVTDDNTAATFCYYCHNPTIIQRRLEGEYRPEKVIPFKFDREKATEIFKNWCKKKPLLSKQFTSDSEVEKLSGVYVPFWLFDCDSNGEISGDAIKVRTYISGDTQYTETKYYHVLREGKAIFSDVPADGSKKMDDELMSILEPYDYKDLTDFSMSYLSGYLAEKYDMDQNDVYGRVSGLIRENMSSLLQETIRGYSSVNIKNSDIKMKNVGATYVLLPVWLFTYQYKGKTYMFAMNGQTGKIAGKLPVSPGRAASWFGGISAAAFAAMLIGGQFLW